MDSSNLPTLPHGSGEDDRSAARINANESSNSERCSNSVTSKAPGTLIKDDIEIIATLGKGGMGVVYKAWHGAMNRHEAVKMLHPHVVQDQSKVQRFLREAQVLRDIKHANVLSVHTVDVTRDGDLFIAMEFLEGRSLSDILESQGPLQPDVARDVFIQICSGLQACHAAGVIHRDLKPANVMIVGEFPNVIAKIVDFGIAKFTYGEGESVQKLTQSGALLGSLEYMAPEQFQGSVDARSDIYSLGCLMYEVLTGKPLFEFSNPFMALRQRNEKPLPFHKVAPQSNIQPSLEAVALKALEPLPEKRFQTVDEVALALKSVNDTPNGHSSWCRIQKPNFRLTTVSIAWISLVCIAVLAASIALNYRDSLAIWYIESVMAVERAPDRRAELALALAHLYDKRGLTNEAFRFYRESFEYVDGLPKTSERINWQLEFADRLRMSNRIRESAQEYTNALTGLIGLVQTNQISSDDKRIRNTALSIEQLDKRSANDSLLRLVIGIRSNFTVAKEILGIIEENGSAHDKESAQLLLGSIFCKEKNPAEATKVFQSLMNTAEPDSISRLAYAAGREFYSCHFYADALDFFLKGLNSKPKSHYEISDADAMKHAGLCYLQMDKPSNAAGYFRDAARILSTSESTDSKLSISILRALGETEYALANYIASEQAFRKQLELLNSNPEPDQREYIIALNHLGETLSMQHKYQSAHDAFNSAVELCRRTGEISLAPEIVEKLERVDINLAKMNR